MELFNLAADNVPEITINKDITLERAREITAELINLPIGKVRFRIGSNGGNVEAGYEIVSGIQLYQNSGGIVETIVTSVANSVASWILSVGTKGHRYAYPFSSGYVHEPVLSDGTTIDKVPDGDLKDRMMHAYNSIITILSNTTGIAKNTMRSLMRKGTRFNADELKSRGFVDKIIPVTNAPVFPKNSTDEEIIEIVNNSNFQPIINKNQSIMKKDLADLLGLDKEASDNAYIQAIKNLAKDNDELKASNKSLTEESATKDKTIETQKTEIGNFVAKENEAFVKENFEESKHEEINNLIKTNGIEAVKTIVNLLPKKSGKAAPKIENFINPEGKEGEDKGNKEVLNKALTYFRGGMKDETLLPAYKEVCNTKEFQTMLKAK